MAIRAISSAGPHSQTAKTAQLWRHSARRGRPQRGALIWGAPTHPQMAGIGIRWPSVPRRRLAPPLRRPRRLFVSATPRVGALSPPRIYLGHFGVKLCLSQSALASRRVFPVGRCGHTIDRRHHPHRNRGPFCSSCFSRHRICPIACTRPLASAFLLRILLVPS